MASLNELLVHLAGSQQIPGELEPGAAFPPLRYALFDDAAPPQEETDDAKRVAGQAA